MDTSEQQARTVLEQIQNYVDALSLRVWIVKQSRYGRRPPPKVWAYLHSFVKRYGIEGDVSELIDLLEAADIRDDLTLGRFLIKWDKLTS
jgi:hypothetical protein